MRRCGQLIVVCVLGVALQAAALKPNERARLVALTDEPDLPVNLRQSVFRSRNLQWQEGILPKNVFNAQDQRDYENFHNSYSQWVIKKFARRWRVDLQAAERKYKVDREAIAAILLVETGLGSFTGNYHVLSVYSSIALEAERRMQLEKLPFDVVKMVVDEQAYRDRLKYKFDWALGELRALLRIEQRKAMDIHALKGSSAGAFGIAQFLPSSYLSWAKDGNGDGRTNLFDRIDAIHSVANYLAEHGWRIGLNRKDNRQAVFAYNRSDIYVDTVLKVAATLRRNLRARVAH